MSSIMGCRKCQTERARISTRDDHHENSGLLKFEVDGDMKGQIVAKERKKEHRFSPLDEFSIDMSANVNLVLIFRRKLQFFSQLRKSQFAKCQKSSEITLPRRKK